MSAAPQCQNLDVSEFLTVIIPVYNAEQDLQQCLDSLYRQTQAVSILIANDGSTDGTKEIATAAESLKSAYVRTINLPHAGLISTRRSAIAKVETEYFAFLDADDRIESTFVEEMLCCAHNHNADIVFCPYLCVYDGIERHVSYGGDGGAFAADAFPIRKNPHLLLSIPTFFWGKLFRTAHFRQFIEYAPEACIPLEDIPAIVPLLIETPRVAKVSHPLYRYTISSRSMCRVAKQELSRLTAMRTLRQRLERIGAIPAFLSELQSINRCHLFDQLEKLRGYCDPDHQHRVVREYFHHLNATLQGWRPHPFHPTFYAAYWHGVIIRNAIKHKWRR